MTEADKTRWHIKIQPYGSKFLYRCPPYCFSLSWLPMTHSRAWIRLDFWRTDLIWIIFIYTTLWKIAISLPLTFVMSTIHRTSHPVNCSLYSSTSPGVRFLKVLKTLRVRTLFGTFEKRSPGFPRHTEGKQAAQKLMNFFKAKKANISTCKSMAIMENEENWREKSKKCFRPGSNRRPSTC